MGTCAVRDIRAETLLSVYYIPSIPFRCIPFCVDNIENESSLRVLLFANDSIKLNVF